MVTAPQPSAREIARVLVEREVVACVNVTSEVHSIYRWEGAIAEDQEALLVIKTTRRQVSPLEEVLREIHPYDTFELLALEVTAGSGPYLQWIFDSIATPSKQTG